MAAQITLKKKQVDEFAAFLRKHNKDKWFLAKDEGAYIGATGGSQEDGTFENILFHFAGCDPKKDEFAWDNARDKFGGDDFGEHFDADVILKLADDPTTATMTLKVTAKSISISSSHNKPAAPKAAPQKAAPKATVKASKIPKLPVGKKLTIGAFVKNAIYCGIGDEEILAAVKKNFPNAKTTVKCLNWYRSQVRKEQRAA